MELNHNTHGCVIKLINIWNIIIYIEWTHCWDINTTIGGCVNKSLLGFLESTSIVRLVCIQTTFIFCTCFLVVHIFWLYQNINSKLPLKFTVFSKCVHLTRKLSALYYENLIGLNEQQSNGLNGHVNLNYIYIWCTKIKYCEPYQGWPIITTL